MPDLPDGEYGFLELYCDDPSCDCRRVIIDVVTPTTGMKIWATISYGRESLEYYEQWVGDKETARECCGLSLDPINAQTEYSPALLRLVSQILEDEAYRERLKRHYQLFKSSLPVKGRSAARRAKRVRRKRR